MPGWDCHGLPIEHNVDKELGSKKKEMTQAEVRRHCRAYAEKFIDIQRDEFKRLGVMGEWDNPYLTMNYALRGDHRQGVLQVCPGRQPVPQQEADSLVLHAARPPWRRLRSNTRMTRSPSIYVKFA